MRPTVALATLGCKVNQYEGDVLSTGLAAGGFALVDFKNRADAYIINACTVTAESDHKCRQLVYRARRLNPDAVVIVTGCFSPSAADDLTRTGVDLLVDNEGKATLAGVLAAKLGANGSVIETAAASRGGRTRAYLKVQDGCEDFCSYCIIPHTRGPVRSRPAAEVVDEARALVDQGVPEIVLTGIHLGKYGSDRRDGGLASLVETLLEEMPLPRLRLSSIELAEVDDRLVDLMAESDRLAGHLHVPLQSGSDRILALMNRRYTAGAFVDRIHEIRERLPDLALSSDVMVGFPTESDADFVETVRTVERCRFSRLHVFRYSARPLTPAAAMRDDVGPALKKDRAAKLRDVGRRLTMAYVAAQKGTTQSVLIESRRQSRCLGLTERYLRVKFNHPTAGRGSLVHVTIHGHEGDVLVGTPQ